MERNGDRIMTTWTEYTPFGLFPLPAVASAEQVFGAGVRFQTQAFRAVMRYQIESLEFLKHRCEQDMKLMDDLTKSLEYKDTFDVVSNFVQNASAEYANEAAKMAMIGSRLASQAAKRVSEEAKTTFEDMAAKSVA
jgi:hypothetical protein